MTKNVDQWCREKDVPFALLVERSGLDETRVLAIYLARWTPSPDERRRIAAALEVEPTDITWGHKTPIQHIYGNGPG